MTYSICRILNATAFYPKTFNHIYMYLYDMHDQFAFRKLFGDVAEDIIEARNFDVLILLDLAMAFDVEKQFLLLFIFVIKFFNTFNFT